MTPAVHLRRLLPEEWELLRAIRLRALQSDPHVFGGSYAGEKDRGADIWRGWARDVSEVALECGHFVVEEEPEQATAALLSFFG